MPVERFDLSFGPTGQPRGDGEPMRLLVLGDFTGNAMAERPSPGSRSLHRIDVDTFDDAMRRLSPRINTPAGEIVFQQLDDFHPDRLFARLDVFKSLREARANPRARNDDLSRLLGTPAESGRGTAPANPIDALIHRIVAPYVVKDSSTTGKAYLSGVDAAIAETMRIVLHDRQFQSIEAAWRGLHWLVSNLELDENLQLHLLDVRREELLRDIVESQGNLAETDLYATTVDRSPQVSGSRRWSALVGLIHFTPSPTDVALLTALAVIASQAGAPLLAGADQTMASADASGMADWQALRRSQAAPWIGLAAPRVLLRLPYGAVTDPIESFAFEEFAGEPQHEQFLWGNGALATALLVGRGFTARGWDMEPGDEREIDDLPAYTFVRDGASEMQACAEQFLTERQIHALLEAGLIPIASRRDRNGVVVIRFQSIADPPAPLAW